MIIIHEREVSNTHGTGVLLKNIMNVIDDRNNIVLCTYPQNTPDSAIPHFYFDDFSLYRGSKIVRKLLLSKIGASLYFRFKKLKFDKISVNTQTTVFITIYTFDLLWRTLKFMRLFPDKKYILYMMDNFIDFDDPEEGQLNKKAFTYITNKAHKRIAISQKLANDLEEITKKKFDTFYGPRLVNWNNINKYYNQKKENKICFLGNAWIEDVLPVVNEQLRRKKMFVTWFTNQKVFEELKQKYSLTNFLFGGSYSSEDVIEAIASFRYGLILYGLESESQNYYNRKLQEYSIPSKIIDYCLAGIEPIYYGPENTACFDFLSSHALGVLLNKSNFIDFLDNFDRFALKPVNLQKMKSIALNSSTESFMQLIKD